MSRRRLIRDICEWWANRPFWRAERRRAYAARCETLEACLAGGASDAARVCQQAALRSAP
jgi:hypothetical protein